MSSLTKSDLDEGARLVGADPFDCCVCPCDACVWLEENAKALIAGCRERNEFFLDAATEGTKNWALKVLNERLRAEIERLKAYINEFGYHADENDLAEGKGDGDGSV